MSSQPRPTIIIILGATGDLMRRKITSALYHLVRRGELTAPFRLYGLAREALTDQAFQQQLAANLETHLQETPDQTVVRQLQESVRYLAGDFAEPETYRRLVQAIRQDEAVLGNCANKLVYLAVPPDRYRLIFTGIHTSSLPIMCDEPDAGWFRLLVEKPFGRSAELAEELDMLLGQLFREEQIFRIDHYLAKELLQNMLTFRFANGLFEPLWNAQYIDRIELRLLEQLDVATRGAFYDGIGALRDVGQNHLLQMLALVTMEQPTDLSATAIRAARTELLRQVQPDPAHSWRGQYSGYRHTPGVAEDSVTETAFRLPLTIGAPRWQGVPVVLEAGLATAQAEKEIVVTLKRPERCLGPEEGVCRYNQVVFSLIDDSITIHFSAKRPGLTYETEPHTFRFCREQESVSPTEEYERLLYDAMHGDQTLFVSTEEIAAMWQTVDPVLAAWQRGQPPLILYEPGVTRLG